MSVPTQYLTGDKKAIDEFLARFDVFVFDCDGVLWSGEHVFPSTEPVLELLTRKGKQRIFVTNNSTKSRADYKKRFDDLSIVVTEDEIFGSAYSAAVYISRILKPPAERGSVFVLGESGIEKELASENIRHVGGTDPSVNRELKPEDFALIASGEALDPSVGVVLVGLDYHVNYLKLAHAFAYLQRGATFLATNLDSTLPNQQSLFPGAGSIAASLIKMTGREPTALGKPSQAMMDAIEGKFKLDRKKACMVGDRLNTDIKFGIDGGLGGTLAVMTGVMKKSDLEGLGQESAPTAYVDKLGDLLL